MKRLYLISFDISKNNIRRYVVKLLVANGDRVQKSVFECLLNDKQYINMKNKLDKLIDKDTDSIRYYFFCNNCKDNISISGQGNYTCEEDLIIV